MRLLVGGGSDSDAGSLILARYRAAFTPGGVECFEPDEPAAAGSPRAVRLHAILGGADGSRCSSALAATRLTAGFGVRVSARTAQVT